MRPDEDELDEDLEKDLEDANEDALPADDLEAAEDKEPEEEETYGAKVQKRIKRETRRRHDAERLAAARAAQLDTALAEIGDLKQRVTGVERVSERVIDGDRQGRADEIRTRLHKAVEEGDTAKQVALTEELTDAKIEERQAAHAKRAREQNGARRTKDAQPEPNPLAESWKRDHSTWFGKKGYDNHTKTVMELDEQVARDGFNPATAAYWDELDTRIEDKLGTLDVANLKPRAKSPVSDARRGGALPSGKHKMTKAERDVAEELGFADDPKAMKRYDNELAKQRAQS